MADIPAHLEKEHILEAQNYKELTLEWEDWPSEYDDDDPKKRRAIKKRIEETTFAVNAFEINEDSLKDFELEQHDTFQSAAVIDGVCFARAYYDGTSKTGAIIAGKPVVFDTVTGKCVTGINAAWQADEYTVVGTSLVDYEETDEDGQDIPIKLSTVGVAGEEGTGVLLYTTYRLPGRYLDDGDKIAGEFTAVVVNIEKTNPGRFKLVHTSERVQVVHPGRRDVRPHMYMWAQKMSSKHAPADVYVVTTSFYE